MPFKIFRLCSPGCEQQSARLARPRPLLPPEAQARVELDGCRLRARCNRGQASGCKNPHMSCLLGTTSSLTLLAATHPHLRCRQLALAQNGSALPAFKKPVTEDVRPPAQRLPQRKIFESLHMSTARTAAAALRADHRVYLCLPRHSFRRLAFRRANTTARPRRTSRWAFRRTARCFVGSGMHEL